jgi:hypothetical protein
VSKEAPKVAAPPSVASVSIQEVQMEGAYNFPGQSPDHMPFAKGDIISVIPDPTKSWWQAKHPKTGRSGIVPKTYLKAAIISSTPSSTATAATPAVTSTPTVITPPVTVAETKNTSNVATTSTTTPAPSAAATPVAAAAIEVTKQPVAATPATTPAVTTAPTETAPPVIVPETKADEEIVEAMFAFAGGGEDQLPFEAGELLAVLEVVDDNWWRCRHTRTNQTGLVPRSYAQPRATTAATTATETPAAATATTTVPTEASVISRAEGLFDFPGDESQGQLVVSIGEVVSVLNKDEAPWWLCRNASGKEGLVPDNYVREIITTTSTTNDTSASSSAAAPAKAAAPVVPEADIHVEATFDFTPVAGMEAEQLEFKQGDVLTVVAKDSDEWWTARNHQGKQGSIPHNYVRVLTDAEAREAQARMEKRIADAAAAATAAEVEKAATEAAEKAAAEKAAADKIVKAEAEKVAAASAAAKHEVKAEPPAPATAVATTSTPGVTPSLPAPKVGSAAPPSSLSSAPIWDAATLAAISTGLDPKDFVRVEAQFDFNAETPTQLTFARGDMMTVISKDTQDWWRATHPVCSLLFYSSSRCCSCVFCLCL